MRVKPAFATSGAKYYPYVVAVFASLLLVSNISATKGVQFGPIGNFPILTDGGFLLFPLAYVLGDVLSEVYGFKAARHAIYLGFGITLGAMLYFQLVLLFPAAPGYTGQQAFNSVLGIAGPTVLIASLAGYSVGQTLNAWVVVFVKRFTDERLLWVRLVGSTVVAELADTLIFCVIAGPAIGIHGFGPIANYTVLGFFYKSLLEVALLPITYPVIGWLKRHEPNYMRPVEDAAPVQA